VAVKDAAQLEEILAVVGAEGSADEYESQELEFKEATDNLRKTFQDLADTAVCLANGGGGTIVLGVNDKARTRSGALVGTGPAYSVDVVRRAIYDRTQPSMTTVADERHEAGVRLVIIDVPPAMTPYANTAGLATRRLGRECRPFPPSQQREFLIATGQMDWSAMSSRIPASTLPAYEVERLRRLLRAAGHSDLAAVDDGALLASLRLVDTDGMATYAAVLLLATPEMLRDEVPGHEVSYQYRPSPGSEASSRLRENRPILAAVESFLDAVGSRRQIYPLNMAGGIQLQLVDYPENAVREVVVNALIHRAYDVPGSVDIEQTPEGLSIASPGGMLPGLSPNNILTHPPTPRHRLLSDVVSMARLAEKTGQGIDRAYREMLRAGKDPPIFEDTSFAVRVRFSGGIGNDAFVRFIAELPESLARDVDVLLALSMLRTSRSISARELSSDIQRSILEAQTVLARLAADDVGLLEPTRRTARRPLPSYRLRPEALAALSRAVSYQRRTLDQIDAKVIEHVREYGFITNRTLQRTFDMHVFAARDLLTDLRRREILEKQGEARGGPGVRYGPGSNFPG
jgi:ATP-dependent DNA helicase RecG